MIINIRDIAFNIISNNISSPQPPIIFLHGFSCSAMDWVDIIKEINNPAYAIDLIGHGKTSSPENILLYQTDNMISSIYEVIREMNIDSFIIAGYSMGGRAALAYELKYPDMLKGLILESTTPGIENDMERAERIKSDNALAELIRKNGIEYFTDYWMNLPLFATQKKLNIETLNKIRESKLKNNITGLSNTLNGFGTGIMQSYWDYLQDIKCSTLLITGVLDEKYTQTAGRMHNEIGSSKHMVIPDAGHNTHLERPDIFIDLVNEFIRKLK